MSAQKDFKPGLDLSPLATATFAQLTQMVANIEPLSNIGGIVWQPGTSQDPAIAQGTGGSPSVTDNPRFERYLWINTFDMPSVSYLYNSDTGDWEVVTVNAASVGPTQLAAHVDLFDHFFTATAADATQANKILRFDSGGDEIIASTLADILAANSVPLEALDKTGATDLQVLQYKISDGLAIFRSLTASSFADNSFGLAKLANATAGYIMQTSALGVWTAVEAKAAMDGKGLYLSSLGNDNSSGGAPAAYQVPMRDSGNTGTFWTDLPFARSFSEMAAASLATGSLTFAHGLGAVPVDVRVVIVCIDAGGDAGWAENDEVDISTLYVDTGGSADGRNICTFGADDASVVVAISNLTTARIANKATAALANITLADWKVKVYARI